MKLDKYQQPDLNLTSILNEIKFGKGFIVLPELFSPDDIDHARQTTLYLINTQGNKATHFQVRLIESEYFY